MRRPSIGWEKAVIGTVLNDPPTIEAAVELLPSDFTGCHQSIWAEMLALHQRNALDLRALVESLRSNNQLDSLGSMEEGNSMRGEGYLADLIMSRGEAVEEYTERVLGASVKRQLAMLGALIRAEAEDDNISATDAADHAEQRLMGLRRNRMVGTGVSIGDILAVYMPRLDGLRNGQIQPAWTPAITAVRKAIQYAESEDFILIAARPGEGKSSMLRYEAHSLAQHNTPVVIFNLENSQIEYARSLLSLRTGIDSLLLKDPRKLSEEQMELIQHEAERLARMPLHVVSLGAPSIDEIERIARYYISHYGIKMIMLDYIQLVKNGAKSRVDDVSASSQGARAMALRYSVPVMAAAQLSRSIEHRGEDAEPELSDLRESGCLTGETMVQLTDGSRSEIKDLVGKQEIEVLSLDETWKIVPAKASKVWCTGVKPVFKLVTATGREIRATGNHPFRKLNEWTALENLGIGDFIAVPRDLPITEKPATITSSEAALLGHLIGDGCTLPRHCVQYTTDELLGAETVVSLVKEVFGESVHPRISRERNWYQVYLKAARSPHTGVHNPVAEWLDRLSIWGCRAQEKHIPEKMYEQPNQVIATFLHHLWSTDGTVGIFGNKKQRPIISFTSSSKKLAQDTFNLLLRLGIVSRIMHVNNHTNEWWMVTITSKSEIMRFIKQIGLMGERSQRLDAIRQFYQERNGNPNRDVIPSEIWYSKILPLCKEKSIRRRDLHQALGLSYSGTQRYKHSLSRGNLTRFANFLESEELKNIANSQVLWDRVVSITPDGIEEVFDMEVIGSHNFVANNTVVHNSLEQDATIVMFPRALWRNPTPDMLARFPENLDDNGNLYSATRAIPIQIYVKKNRNGATSITEPMLWIKSTGELRTLVRGSVNNDD